MLLFGVTGGIGTGKTAVCKILNEYGIPVIEADPLAKRLTVTVDAIKQALTREFGTCVYTEDGALNKQVMRDLVFSSEETREKINSIIHPHVLKSIQKEADRLFHQEKQAVVGVEAALIYESKMQKILDLVVVVDASVEQRIKRVQKRDDLSPEAIRKRIDAQMPMSEKKHLADYVITNETTIDELKAEVAKLRNWLLSRLA